MFASAIEDLEGTFTQIAGQTSSEWRAAGCGQCLPPSCHTPLHPPDREYAGTWRIVGAVVPRWIASKGLMVVAYPADHLPEYFCSKFHAYSEGNLCWEAAFEQMVAGKGVGVRNFPEFGPDGEDHMRWLHENAMCRLGAHVPEGSTIVDMGCGTGVSSRRLAAQLCTSTAAQQAQRKAPATARRWGREKRATVVPSVP